MAPSKLISWHESFWLMPSVVPSKLTFSNESSWSTAVVSYTPVVPPSSNLSPILFKSSKVLKSSKVPLHHYSNHPRCHLPICLLLYHWILHYFLETIFSIPHKLDAWHINIHSHWSVQSFSLYLFMHHLSTTLAHYHPLHHNTINSPLLSTLNPLTHPTPQNNSRNQGQLVKPPLTCRNLICWTQQTYLCDG